MKKIFLIVLITLAAEVAYGQGSLQQAVEFLTTYSTPADLANYSEDYFCEQARYALYARIDMPWGEQVPDSLWRHYVLPPRVNNEALDDFRQTKYDELRLRVQGMTMQEAALEVNHWCHEYVTYRPSDGRTSAPLSTLRNGYGRCGEESVLAVAAMRAVGIPSRQVYTPRWAHTDDNHAWIEVWVDGRWYFMGACEPEPVLNMAWFNSSAARAMLMHTRVFGDWRGAEDVISRNDYLTEINVIANYVPTRRANICVVDADDNPVAGALVEFKIFNYSEFCTVATMKSDAEGNAALTTGMGEMLVWASYGDHFGYAKINSEQTTVILNHEVGEIISEDIDITPPADGLIPYTVTDEQLEQNKLRLAAEDSLRASRYDKDAVARLANEHCYDDTERQLLLESRNNYAVLSAFLEANAEPQARQQALAILQSLTAKDLRDVTIEVLAEAMDDVRQMPTDDANLCSPRVELETLAPFVLPEQMRHLSVDDICAWTRDSITIVPNPRSLRFTPAAVLRTRQADETSRSIFFVRLCRKNGIPARIEPVTGRTEYMAEGGWQQVRFGADDDVRKTLRLGKLRLNYTPTQLHPELLYYRHFTISRIENGVMQLLNYEEGENTEMGATVTTTTFSAGRPLPMGYYMVTTGNRMADGSVRAHIQTLNIRYPRTSAVTVSLREGDENNISVKGYFNADPLLPMTGRGFYLLMLTANNEPTSHARQELAQIENELKAWGRPMVTLDGDEWRSLAQELRAAVNSQQSNLPIVVIADSFGRIVFYSEGYDTSLGEKIKRVISHL